MFRHQIYQQLGQQKDEFLKRIATQAKRVGMPEKWQGAIGLTGSNSDRKSVV